jgi:hypothetical protein
MNATELKNTLKVAMKNNLPVLIKGAPGVGKSDIVEQVARILKMNLIICHPVVSDPTDYKGLPGIVNGAAEFLPFGDLRAMMEAVEPTIVFFDDIGQAPACVQAALMQLFLARQVNGKAISKHIVFVAATNRRQDRAGVTGILEPVKSRFATIIELTPDIKSWIKWATRKRMPVELIDFLQFRPDLLMTGEATADIVNHPCPRTWAYVGKLLHCGLNSIEVLAGAVGEGPAGELVGFLRAYEDLPDIDEVLENPTVVKVPTEPGTLYAVVRALVKLLDRKNGNNIMVYTGRLPADFCILLMLEAKNKMPQIQETKGFINLAVKHQDITL